ncbi:uncharacterized protein LOC113294939 [Papaver somniferum]|uniref:uncharacterized protein LOC113294939 n=1 Tax=Papaver somniferum TaxID=3469 RepID=UPI000E703053|nr:uncharacterized protein LOC113294939 [Papaver somniferum]
MWKQDAGTAEVGSKIPFLVAISDDELGSINRANDPCSSPEYNPATPPSKTPKQPRLPFKDAPFHPGLYRSTGSAVTISDSAIQNPTVARGIMLSGMLPVDRHCYDQMTGIDQALDRATQFHFAGLSLVRKVGEIHYEALVRRQKAHELALHRLERENDRLKRQIESLHAEGRDADNALKLMRKQRDRANFKVKGLGGYAAAPSDVEKAVDGVDDKLYYPEEE